jgi:glutathione S-transferase
LYAVAAYERAFGALEAALAEGGPWILGGQATLADVALMPYVARLDYLGLLEAWTENRPHIGDWWAQTQEWPSFKRGLRERVSEDEFAEMRTHGPKIRTEVAALVAGLRHAEHPPTI